MRKAGLGLFVAMTIASAPARADRGLVERWMKQIDDALAVASKARTPPLRPPVPVAVTWKPRRLASLGLGSPLLAIVAGDLDGDKRAEIYAVTETDVIVLDVAGRALKERTRVALPEDPAAIRPREAVATAYIERDQLRVRASSRGRGGRYAWRGKALELVGTVDDYPVCTGRALSLVSGRNHFGAIGAPIHGVRCRDDLVDPSGAAQSIVAELGAGGALAVSVTPRCPPAATCAASAPVAVAAIGTAFAVADLDRDGKIEIVAAGAGAPGDKDAIKVLEANGSGFDKKPIYRKPFTGGVVAIAVGDVDGDGADEAIGVVRLPGVVRIDFWQLNQ
jgi:hypothetical protein